MNYPNVGATDQIAICDGVSARDFDGEWIILDLQGGNYYGLNELGGVVWHHLHAGRCAQEIAAAVAPMYAVSEQTILIDVLALINELVERGLVRPKHRTSWST